ncbi:MAG: histidine kinase dimerization/phospho-acceptor domain-containing protein, partial [Halobacteriaceae archaeon]
MVEEPADATEVSDGDILRGVLDFLDELLVVFDSRGRLRRWNWALPEVTECGGDELAGTAAGDLVVEEHADRMAGVVAEATETGYAAVDATFRAPDGGIPVEFRMSRVPLDGGHGVLAVGFNVTARRDRERRLQQLRARSLELMNTKTATETAQVAADAAHDIIGTPLSGVYLPDETGATLEPVAVAAPVPETLGEPPQYSRDGDPGSRDALAWEVFDGGEPLRIDDTAAFEGLEEPTPVGSVVLHPLSGHGLFVVADSEPGAFDDADTALIEILAAALTTALDRVERERRLRERERELERRNERLEEFASVVSHDLRSPLNVAQGHLDLARGHRDGDHLEAVARAHERMEELVEDILALAREEESEPDTEPVALDGVVERCWGTVRTGEATLRVETDRTVRADRSRLRQLFENLVRNAVEHG